MKFLIKKVTIADRSSSYFNKIKDVLIVDGIKRSWIRFNIFRFRYKVKYLITVTYDYNPVEKISK